MLIHILIMIMCIQLLHVLRVHALAQAHSTMSYIPLVVVKGTNVWPLDIRILLLSQP